jgi:hypothetical protein
MLALALLLAGAPCDEPGPIGELDADLTIASARIEEGVAFVRVRVEATPTRVEGELSHGSTSVMVSLPTADAIVKGAVLRTASGRQELALEEATVADEKMDRFSDELMMGVEPEQARRGKRRAAASVAYADDGVYVRIIAACSEARVTVDLDVEVTSTSADGAWRFLLPRPTLHDATVRSAPLSIDAPEMELLVDGGQLSRARVLLDEEAPLIVVDARPRIGPKLRGRAGLAHVTPRAAPAPEPDDDDDGELPETPAAEDDDAMPDAAAPIDILRAELDLPRPLASPPQGLHLVFVVDASVSSGEGGLAAGVRILERVLDAAPGDTRWAAVAIGHRARVIVPAWRARDDRGVVQVPIENGSDVAGALKLAQTLASDVEGVGRVVVLSDLMAASAAPSLAVTLRPAPLVHVVQLPEDLDVGGEITWQRTLAGDAGTDDVLAVERTGGIFVWGGMGDEDERVLAPHLIAPTRIDAPEIAFGETPLAFDELTNELRISHEEPGQSGGWPTLLHAGQGVRADVLVDDDARGTPVFRGLLWAEPLEVSLERTHARDKRALALAAAGALSKELEDDVVRGAAIEAGVVSRMTSLVYVPTWRPVQEALMGIGRCGCCCGCGLAMSGHSASFTTRCGMGQFPDYKEREVLQGLLMEDLQVCRAPSATLTVEVEDLEILAVSVADVDTPRAARCIEDRFWLHRIDALASGGSLVPGAFESRKTLTVEAVVENADAGG